MMDMYVFLLVLIFESNYIFRNTAVNTLVLRHSV